MALCKACSKEIYFLRTAKHGLIPVNADSLSSAELRDCKEGLKRLFDAKKHISHFATCPEAETFRKRNEPITEQELF